MPFALDAVVLSGGKELATCSAQGEIPHTIQGTLVAVHTMCWEHLL